MKTKKLFSILLALMMMLSVVPMYASAADPIALTKDNITEWPVTSFVKDGAMYFGQKVGEAVIISGGIVEYNGVVIPGHFEHLNSEYMPTNAGSTVRADVKFIPDDETAYTGFEVKRNKNITYPLTKVTPVYVDEENDPVMATEVEAGATLSTSELSGGKMTNPYNSEEPNVNARTWEWVSPATVVNESGYYEAMFVPPGYEKITAQVYVRIAGEIPETTITEAPTVPADLKYDGVTTWGDVELKGGKAVLKIEGTEVTGTFAVTEYWKTRTVNPGSYEIDVTFTPDDPEAALPYSLKIPVTVNKGQIKFVDENGAEIVPEITVPYGTKFNDVSRLLKPYVKGPEYVYFVMGDLESQLCENGTYTVTATAPSDGAHYEDTELTFKIVVEPKVINPKFYSTTGGSYIQDSSGIYRPEGTFDIYVDDELVHSGIKYLEDKFELTFPENVTATYTIKAVYNPVENDNYSIDDVIYQKNVIAKHGLTLKKGVANYKLGDDIVAKSITNETISITEGAVVALEAVSEDFAEWIITDAKGNALDLDIKTVVTNVDENGGITWETVDGDLSCENIIFTMPTEDVIITLRTTKDIAAENCDHICHSDNPLFQMLWKVLTFIFRLFDVQQYCDCGNLHYDAPLFG